MNRPLGLVVTVWGVVLSQPQAVVAQDRALDDPVAVVERLLQEPLGAPRKFFEKRVTDEITASFRRRIRASRDPVERDRLRRALPRAIRAFEATWVSFGPAKSPYDHSVIAGEFRHDPSDGLLERVDGERTWYYFFREGRLWKLIVTIPPVYDFGAAALRLTPTLGPPADIEVNATSPKRALASVRWKHGDVVVEIADRRVDYACYTVKVVDARVWQEHPPARRPSRRLDLDPLVRDAIGAPAPKAGAGAKPARRGGPK